MPSLQLDTAIELARADDYPNAIEQLSLLIDRGQGEEDDITARRWRSVCYGQSGRMKEALTDANWLIDHGCVELHAWRGYLRERLREYDGAITDYSYAIADDADKAPAAQYDLYLKRGHVYFAIKRYADALSDFTTAISFTDQAAELEAVHIWRGNTYIELGDRKAAAQAFKLAQAIANDKE